MNLRSSRALRVLAVSLAGVLTATGCGGTVYGRPGPVPSKIEQKLVFQIDMKRLITPAKDYLGIARDGLPDTVQPLKSFASTIGVRPNLVKVYTAWNSSYDPERMKALWAEGAIPWIEWEPHETSPASVVAGDSDKYIRDYALAVKQANVPIGISWAHEFNGYWYTWGNSNGDKKSIAAKYSSTPDDIVKSWQHIVKIFREVEANNVIWTWTPNVINPKSINNVKLKPYYPGDDYVDWIGVVGYFQKDKVNNPPTNSTELFWPTMKQIRGFTKKPFILAETGSEEGPAKAAEIKDMFQAVATNKQIIGLLWFDIKKPSEPQDWRIASSNASLLAFKRQAANPAFAFDPRKP